MTNLFRDNGGKHPPGLGYFHNLLSPPGPSMRLLKRKRHPIVKVRKSKSLFNLLFGWLWKWECRICYQNRLASTWEKAVEQATHHAHNHHRSQK